MGGISLPNVNCGTLIGLPNLNFEIFEKVCLTMSGCFPWDNLSRHQILKLFFETPTGLPKVNFQKLFKSQSDSISSVEDWAVSGVSPWVNFTRQLSPHSSMIQQNSQHYTTTFSQKIGNIWNLERVFFICVDQAMFCSSHHNQIAFKHWFPHIKYS